MENGGELELGGLILQLSHATVVWFQISERWISLNAFRNFLVRLG